MSDIKTTQLYLIHQLIDLKLGNTKYVRDDIFAVELKTAISFILNHPNPIELVPSDQQHLLITGEEHTFSTGIQHSGRIK